MKQHTYENECEVADVPASPLLAEDRKARYGHVAGLDDDELADPYELEKQVLLADWGPILALPVRTGRSWIQPTLSEDFGVDYGAFASVDFERTVPEFDKLRYKADKLREDLRDVLIMASTISYRLPRAKYRVLKYLRLGIIELEHIESLDMHELGRLHLRALRLQRQIKELREASFERCKAKLAEVLG